MKHAITRRGCAALCVALSLALGCGCSLLPPASEKPASSAPSIPTDANGQPLYDPTPLEDGLLRALYGYDGGSTTILCGSKVLYQGSRSENLALLQDSITGETNYWFRSWSDPTGRGGRRSALYDKTGTAVMTFDGNQSAGLQNGLLVLQEAPLVNGRYADETTYGSCQVVDLATGQALPVPEGAYSCVVSGDKLVFNCYARPAELAEDDWDTDYASHNWVVVQEKDGTQLCQFQATSVYGLSYVTQDLGDWVELDTATDAGTAMDLALYNPSTGERYDDFSQAYNNGYASFRTADGQYQLRDMTAPDRGVVAVFEDLPSHCFPGHVVTWRIYSDYGYDLHDLETGQVTPLYQADATDSTVAVYTKAGSLQVYDSSTGALVVDTPVEPVENQQSVLVNNCGSGYVWLELRDNDRYDTTATRVYGPQGLVTDLTPLQDQYTYLGFLTTDTDGSPLYYGTRSAAGSSYGTVSDVLDAQGSVVMQGLSGCYGYYTSRMNSLPDHVFVAKRGFYSGWMDTQGRWLYCQSIFSSVSSDDEWAY